jgi:hypothetical protein
VFFFCFRTPTPPLLHTIARRCFSNTLLASNLSLKCIKIVNKKGWPFVFKVKRVRVDEGVGQN